MRGILYTQCTPKGSSQRGIDCSNAKLCELVCAAHNLKLIRYDSGMGAFKVNLENCSRYLNA